ncbi:hypothetical protein ACQEXU_12220 [Vibrio sp. TRT 21S02]|uniref:hypothetical protein n=1 Tax=unclassified Vibrio TaxID=2614977 RepID=UPI00349FD033
MKISQLSILSLLFLAGCQTTNLSDIQTSASPDTIQIAKNNLMSYENFNVTDNGVIVYQMVAEIGYFWKPVVTKELSFRIACEELKWYVDKGMTVRINFKGRRGMINDYDQNRCQTEIPTNLLESNS